MSTLGKTTRITNLDEGTDVASDDELAMVDKSDTSGSVDGTDKKWTAQSFAEEVPVRPSTDQNAQKKLSEWVGMFRDTLSDLVDKTKKATTTRWGITRYAKDSEAKSKSSGERSITPKNLDALGSTESLAGLVALASVQGVSEGKEGDTAATPYTLFHGLLGESALGNDDWSFKIPTRNVVGDVKTELVVQVGQREFDTTQTLQDPETNYNHIHDTVEFDVTFSQPFPNTTLMVIPLGLEATPSSYTEGTNFWIRPFEIRKSGATLRASRINGKSDGDEIGAVRYLAIGY